MQILLFPLGVKKKDLMTIIAQKILGQMTKYVIKKDG